MPRTMTGAVARLPPSTLYTDSRNLVAFLTRRLSAETHPATACGLGCAGES